MHIDLIELCSMYYYRGSAVHCGELGDTFDQQVTLRICLYDVIELLQYRPDT